MMMVSVAVDPYNEHSFPAGVTVVTGTILF